MNRQRMLEAITSMPLSEPEARVFIREVHIICQVHQFRAFGAEMTLFEGGDLQ
jgi:hypothetical protein